MKRASKFRETVPLYKNSSTCSGGLFKLYLRHELLFFSLLANLCTLQIKQNKPLYRLFAFFLLMLILKCTL
jgi:hypothetical protein